MATPSSIEFALSEFAAFELSREVVGDALLVVTGASPAVFLSQAAHAGGLTSVGTGITQFTGGSDARARLYAAGYSQTTLASGSIASVVLSSRAAAATALSGQTFVPSNLVIVSSTNAQFTTRSHSNAELHAVGAALVSLQSGALSKASFQATASAVMQWKGEAQQATDLQTTGRATVSWSGAKTAGTTLYVTSPATMALVGGKGVGSSLSIAGKAIASFDVPTEPEYLIRGRSIATFTGQGLAYGSLTVVAIASQSLTGLTIASTQLHSSGVGMFSVRAQPYRVAKLASFCAATAQFNSATKHAATFQASSSSLVSPVGVAVIPARMASANAGSALLSGSSLSQGRLNAAGSSSMSMEIIQVLPSDLFAIGSGAAYFYIGSAVYRFLPQSYDSVERPAEARSAGRPAESRAVEF